MDFLPYNNPLFHPGFEHHNDSQSSHTYPQYPDQQHRSYAMPRRSNSMTDLNQMARSAHGDKGDTKPRLSKSEVEILERQFQEQHKPSSNTKRQLAERMGVEIARINNWFQNRRAKAKQEKKQIEFGLREAGSLAYSEPSSPEHFNPTGYFDGHFQSSESHLGTFPSSNGGSASVASYPHYENPTAASLNSLQRTLIEAEAAVTRGEFDDEYQDQQSNDHFSGPLSYDGYPTADRAQFPTSDTHPLGGFAYTNEIFTEQHLAQPMMLQEPQEPQGPQSFGCYVNSPEEQHAIVEPSVPTFPSQLLAGHCEQDLTPRPFQPLTFEDSDEGAGFQSPASSIESRFKSPPPPADIAARRRKDRPAAIGTSALRDKTSTGPKTSNNSEAVKRLHGSPSAAMRRVSSASGLNVLAGRVQKSSQMPLRSPLKRNFSAGTPSLDQNPHLKMPLRNRSWLSTPRGPPTPRSPREMLLTQGLVLQEGLVHQDETFQRDGQTPQDQNTPSSSSQSESDGGYLYERPVPTCFNAHGLINMASPPETPGNPNGVIHWGYEVPDEALLTPGFSTFADGMMQMPQPHYVSPLTASQPPTPAFGGHFNGFPFAHHSPVFEMVPVYDSGASEYCFPDNGLPYPMIAATKAPEQARDKIYTFNNATQKDFESS